MPVATVKEITPAEGNRPLKVRLSDDETRQYAVWHLEEFPNLTVNTTGEYTAKNEPATRNGRTYQNWTLLTWTPTNTKPAVNGTSEPKASVPAEVWEAKDRRIAMESAYGSAARIAQALAAAKPETLTGKLIMDIAHTIYRDVQAAGQGKTFAPEPDRET